MRYSVAVYVDCDEYIRQSFFRKTCALRFIEQLGRTCPHKIKVFFKDKKTMKDYKEFKEKEITK